MVDYDYETDVSLRSSEPEITFSTFDAVYNPRAIKTNLVTSSSPIGEPTPSYTTPVTRPRQQLSNNNFQGIGVGSSQNTQQALKSLSDTQYYGPEITPVFKIPDSIPQFTVQDTDLELSAPAWTPLPVAPVQPSLQALDANKLAQTPPRRPSSLRVSSSRRRPKQVREPKVINPIDAVVQSVVATHDSIVNLLFGKTPLNLG